MSLLDFCIAEREPALVHKGCFGRGVLFVGKWVGNKQCLIAHRTWPRLECILAQQTLWQLNHCVGIDDSSSLGFGLYHLQRGP